MKVTMTRVNGVGYVIDENGNKRVPRKVIERNVLDMLEENEQYGNLGFLDAQEIVEQATVRELLDIYTERMTTEEFAEVQRRILGC